MTRLPQQGIILVSIVSNSQSLQLENDQEENTLLGIFSGKNIVWPMVLPESPKVAFLRVSAPKWFHSQFNLRNYIINFKHISLLQDSWRFHLLIYNCVYPRGWHNMQLFLNSLGKGGPFWKSFFLDSGKIEICVSAWWADQQGTACVCELTVQLLDANGPCCIISLL